MSQIRNQQFVMKKKIIELTSQRPQIARGRFRQVFDIIFETNEELALNDNQGRPLTDDEIVALLNECFPRNSKRRKAYVRTRRIEYNLGEGTWGKYGDPEYRNRHISYAYDRDGNRLLWSTGSSSSNEDPTPSAPTISTEDILEIVRKEMQTLSRKTANVVVEIPKRKVHTKLDGTSTHERFHDVLMRVKAGVPILLVGPTGCGKTHLASQVAKSLDLDFSMTSMSEGVSESHLLGRKLPNKDGAFVYEPSPFIKAYQSGGVHLLDEIDAADPNMLVQINAACSNGCVSVPVYQTEPLQQHEDFVLIAAANTFGYGASREYVGRNQLDAATINRYQMGTIEMDYDKNVERAIAQSVIEDEDVSSNLLRWAWVVRDKIADHGVRRVMSTRTIEHAARLLRAGVSMEETATTYFTGWSQNDIDQIAPDHSTLRKGSAS